MRAVAMVSLVLAETLLFTPPVLADCVDYEDYLHQEGGLWFPYYAKDVVFAGQYAYAACGPDGLRVIDISDTENPAVVGTVDAALEAHGVAVSGNYAYMADVFTLDVILITDPEHPQLIRSVGAPARIWKIVISGSYAYVLGGTYEPRAVLAVYDLANPEDPQLIATLYAPGADSGGADLGISGAYVYVTVEYADHWELQVVSVADPQDPAVVSRLDMPDAALGLAVDDYFCYVATYAAGLQVISITDPYDPRLVGSVLTPPDARDVAVANMTAFVAASTSGLLAVDVFDPRNPVIVGAIRSANYVTLAAASGDIACYGLSGGAPLILQFVDISNPRMPGIVGSVDTPSTAEDVAVSGSYAYVADTDHLQVVDITKPESPWIVGSTPAQATNVDLSEDYVCVGRNETLQVIDVADAHSPRVIGSVNTEYIEGIAVSGTHAYVAGYTGTNGTLQVVDLANPRSPEVVGTVTLAWAQVPRGVAVAGSLVYVVTREQPRFLVIDVSDPEDPQLVGSLASEMGALTDVAVSGGFAYVTDEGSTLYVIDVSDLADLRIVSSAQTGDSFKSVTVAGEHAYVTDGGLTVVDVSDPTNARVTGCAGFLAEGTRSVAVENGLCYVAVGGAGLQILPVQCEPQSGLPQDEDAVSDGITLSVRPNPTFANRIRGGTGRIELVLDAAQAVRVAVFDVLGRRITTVWDRELAAGVNVLQWDARSLPAGTYYVCADGARGSVTRSALVIE